MNISVKIGKLKLKNPVMTASGTFGVEYVDFMIGARRAVPLLGAIIMKTVTLKPRPGNPPPRIIETPSGMLNSIGLENVGLERFIKEKLPRAKKFNVPVIVSISADSNEEFAEMVSRLDKAGIDGIELNLSCPNVCRDRSLPVPVPAKVGKAGKTGNGPMIRRRGRRTMRPTSVNSTQLIAQDPNATYEVIRAVRKITGLTLIAKLTPNVTDITEIAKAAQDAGADAVSLINTFTGMAVDIETRTPKLGAVTGGLSGPAIKPIALRMVWEVFNKVGARRAVPLPIIGIGGIMDYRDALEFIICGATAVQVGTANFVNPKATIEIVEGIKGYLRDKKIADIRRLIGNLRI